MEKNTTTHKLTAIFYADVAGYSRLTGSDELGTHQVVMDLLDYAQKTIQQKGGKVLRYAGDAILAEFSSVVSCVDAAPPTQAYDVFEHLSALVDEQLAGLQSMIEEDVVAFNALINSANFPAVGV